MLLWPEPQTSISAPSRKPNPVPSSFLPALADAINIFLHQSLMVGGLPFEVRQPRFNAETEAAMQEARDIASGKISAKRYDSARALLEDLDKEC